MTDERDTTSMPRFRVEGKETQSPLEGDIQAMTKDIATVKAALDLLHEIKAQLRTHVEFDHATRLMAAVGDMAEAARAYVETALSSPPAIDLEAKRDALNKIDDALLLFRNDKPYTSEMMPSIAFSKDELLSLRAIHQQPCEAESLKRHNYKDRSYVDYGCPKSEEDGWNDCIDHLAATGKLGGDDLGELLTVISDLAQKIELDGTVYACHFDKTIQQHRAVIDRAYTYVNNTVGKSAMEKMEEGE